MCSNTRAHGIITCLSRLFPVKQVSYPLSFGNRCQYFRVRTIVLPRNYKSADVQRQVCLSKLRISASWYIRQKNYALYFRRDIGEVMTKVRQQIYKNISWEFRTKTSCKGIQKKRNELVRTRRLFIDNQRPYCKAFYWECWLDAVFLKDANHWTPVKLDCCQKYQTETKEIQCD